MRQRSTLLNNVNVWELSFNYLKQHEAHFKSILNEFQLTHMELFTLRALPTDDEGITTAHLAATIGSTSPNTTPVVDRLEKRGLVVRRSRAHDRRVRLVALTREGRNLRHRIDRRMSDTPPFIAKLSTHEQRQLHHLLHRILGMEKTA